MVIPERCNPNAARIALEPVDSGVVTVVQNCYRRGTRVASQSHPWLLSCHRYPLRPDGSTSGYRRVALCRECAGQIVSIRLSASRGRRLSEKEVTTRSEVT